MTLFTDGLETQPYSGWLRDVYLCFAGAAPPEHLLVPPDEIGDAAVELQDWCAEFVPLGWLTGIGLMEACWAQVDEAINNANLRRRK